MFGSHWERHLFKLGHASQAVSNKCPIFRRDLTRWSSRQIAFALCSKPTCSIRIGRRSTEASRAYPEFSAAPVAAHRTVTAYGPERPGGTSAHVRFAVRLRAPGGRRFRLSPKTPFVCIRDGALHGSLRFVRRGAGRNARTAKVDFWMRQWPSDRLRPEGSARLAKDANRVVQYQQAHEYTRDQIGYR